MKPANLMRSIALGLAGVVGHAHAVNLSTNGMGQVLIYPYYTVNAGQQTLVTIGNFTDVGKAVRVRFMEGYNGRSVMEFNLFLSSNDIWTAVVFKLSDGNMAGSGAGIFTNDNSCIAPHFSQGPMLNDRNYQSFLNYAYTGSQTDTGPTDDSRTNEGHFEVIAMSDILPGSALDRDTTHVNSVPPGCAQAESDFEAGASTIAPTSGLYGAASIVNVGQGTIYAYNAEAIDGFTAIKLDTPTGIEKPTLASANDVGDFAGTVTSHVFIGGQPVDSVFPASRAIDAVSSLFMVDAIYNEYVYNVNDAAGTDWIVTFPTKRFYVDGAHATGGVAPFEHPFGAKETGNGLGASCAYAPYLVYDRERNVVQGMHCNICPCPPAAVAPGLCLETSLVRFSDDSVLGSQLGEQVEMYPVGTGGAARIALDDTSLGHAMIASTNGNVFHGLPAIGFAVTQFVNGSLSPPGGGAVLANYSALYRHRGTSKCTRGSGGC